MESSEGINIYILYIDTHNKINLKDLKIRKKEINIDTILTRYWVEWSMTAISLLYRLQKYKKNSKLVGLLSIPLRMLIRSHKIIQIYNANLRITLDKSNCGTPKADINLCSLLTDIIQVCTRLMCWKLVVHRKLATEDGFLRKRPSCES